MHRHYIEAPAGYGKTEELVKLVVNSNEERKILLLTHTRAGVAAIQKRLEKYSVASSKYEISTIDSFCMAWCKAYPKTSGFLYCMPYQYGNIQHYYVDIHYATAFLLEKEWMQHILKNAYSQVIVDEYQDCTLSQHKLLLGTLSKILPMTILGDPLQGIFYFQGKSELPCDLYSIEKDCDSLQQLTTPWRWKESNLLLGNWISELRGELMKADRNGKELCIFAPAPCDFIAYISPKNFIAELPELSSNQASIAFIARNEKVQLFFNRRTGGRYSYHEKKDNEQLIDIIKKIDVENTPFTIYIEIYKMAYSHVSENLSTIEKKLSQCQFNEWRGKKYSDLFYLFCDLSQIPFSERIQRYNKIKEILCWIKQKKEFSCLRRKFYNQLMQIIDSAISKNISLEEAYCQLYTFCDDIIPNTVSTRTVLSKGLEFDAVIIDISAELDRLESLQRNESPRNFYYKLKEGVFNWDIRNFYVAISRAKRKIYFIGEQNQKIKLKEYRKGI